MATVQAYQRIYSDLWPTTSSVSVAQVEERASSRTDYLKRHDGIDHNGG
jgi:hypothetical protein